LNIFVLLAPDMAKQPIKKIVYKGRNIRISNEGFDKIKLFVDLKGYKLGRFVEDAAIKELKLQSK